VGTSADAEATRRIAEQDAPPILAADVPPARVPAPVAVMLARHLFAATPGWEPYAHTLMSLGDVNGDGRSDIGAVHNGTATFTIWNGKGGNTFGPATPIGSGWAQRF
jgi:hypothetical protein